MAPDDVKPPTAVSPKVALERPAPRAPANGGRGPAVRVPSESPLRWRPATRGPRDLRVGAFPVARPDDWADPEEALETLYRRAEAKATEAVDWYLRDKRLKKICTRGLRVLAILLAAAGLIAPLVELARPGGHRVEWGYVLLGAAVAAVAFDRFLGLSQAWGRDVTAALRLERRLEVFQYDWANALAPGPAVVAGTADSVAARLALLRAFTVDVTDLVAGETAEWNAEFRSGLDRLDAAAVARRPRPPAD